MNEARKRILVTGATGFVGRGVMAALAAAGHEVVGAVRLAPNPEAKNPISPALRVVGDIGPETEWGEALAGVDTVVHLAALAHLSDACAASRSASEAFHRVNALGTARLARQASRASVRRFILMSSVGVNGQSSGSRAFRETDAPPPHSDYARSKLAAETAVAEAGREDGMEWLALRPPMVIGPGAPGNFARLVGLVRRGIPLPLGAATAPKSFIGIDNLASAVVAAVTTRNAHALNCTYLVADTETASTARLVREIAAALGRPSRLVPVPRRAIGLGLRMLGRGKDLDRLFDPLEIDSSAFRKAFNWQPPLTFSEGVRRAVAGER